MSVLVTLLVAGARYLDQPARLSAAFATASYDVYLTHIWFVIGLAGVLLGWTAPSPIKAALVFAGGLTLSFILSRWVIGRYPRTFTAGLLALFGYALLRL
jgi:hypothetical protein